ncbi:MAG: ThuA domain-containing protein [Geminicoccaceae bacterium]|nr:ThuA domain-containing protein [Geminicoccaceae bacterium]MDW8123835.1 ThuA domain-containing protein [Geminicoccaceae bacterium]
MRARALAAALFLAALAPARASQEVLLLVTATAGYRHESIPAAVRALTELAEPLGLMPRRLEGPTPLPALDLRDVRVVALVHTTGTFLAPEARAALAAFVHAGGGLFAVHAAADAHYEDPLWRDLVGAWFLSHPPGLQTTVVRFAEELPGFAALGGGRRWVVTDELYDFRDNPRGRVRVIATVDETTYAGGRMGADHPIAWCHEPGRGRSWYTGLGHRPELWDDPVFREHLGRGLAWVARRGATC